MRIDHHDALKGLIFDLKVAESYTNPVVTSPPIHRFLIRSLGSR
jgi:hypothetical protein